MRIKNGFELRDICGEKVVMATGIENVDFSQMISLNESAAFLWSSVENVDFDETYLANLLCQEYEVDEPTALKDAENVIKEWVKCGIIE